MLSWKQHADAGGAFLMHMTITTSRLVANWTMPVQSELRWQQIVNSVNTKMARVNQAYVV